MLPSRIIVAAAILATIACSVESAERANTTHEGEMSLPLSRDFDAVDAGPLPHTTVNAIQDAIVQGQHGRIVRVLSFGDLRVHSDYTLDVANSAYWEVPATALRRWRVILPLAVGERVHKVSFWQRDIAPGVNGDGLHGFLLSRTLPAFTGTTPIDDQDSDRSGTDQKTTIDITGAPKTVIANEVIELHVLPSSTTSDLGGGTLRLYPVIELDTDAP